MHLNEEVKIVENINHYYAVVRSDDELKHYGVKGMHWGIRRYQPYTSNPRKGGKTGKFIGKNGKVNDKNGSLGALIGVGGTLAAFGGMTAIRKLKKKKETKNVEKQKIKNDAEKEKKAKEGLKYLEDKFKDAPEASKEIKKAATDYHNASQKYNEYYLKADLGTAEDFKKYMPKAREWEEKMDSAHDKYEDTLHKWDFNMDGETEYSYEFLKACSDSVKNSKMQTNIKNGKERLAKSGIVKERNGMSPYEAFSKIRKSENEEFRKAAEWSSQRNNRHRVLPYTSSQHDRHDTKRGRDNENRLKSIRDMYNYRPDPGAPSTLLEAWKEDRRRRGKTTYI